MALWRHGSECRAGRGGAACGEYRDGWRGLGASNLSFQKIVRKKHSTALGVSGGSGKAGAPSAPSLHAPMKLASSPIFMCKHVLKFTCGGTFKVALCCIFCTMPPPAQTPQTKTAK